MVSAAGRPERWTCWREWPGAWWDEGTRKRAWWGWGGRGTGKGNVRVVVGGVGLGLTRRLCDPLYCLDPLALPTRGQLEAPARARLLLVRRLGNQFCERAADRSMLYL